MKKSKGFTIIELLAVIVILAIITLIATPMVLKYIENAKEKSGEQSIRSMVRAAETYRMANFEGTKFPMTISFPDSNNTLNLKNISKASGYLKINNKGDSELLITIDNITYAKNFGDDKIYNLNKDNYIYDGGSDEWIVSKKNPAKLISWKPMLDYQIPLITEEYISLPYLYYNLSAADYTTTFSMMIDKKETIEASMKEFENKYKNYMRFIPTVLKDEVKILKTKLKDKYGDTVTDSTLITEEELNSFFEQIKDEIPIIYDCCYGSFVMNLRLGKDQKIDITTIIPSKVNGHNITTIANDTLYDDCDTSDECIDLYGSSYNYYYNLIISEGIDVIGDSYFVGRQIYSLKLPSTIKEIGANAFTNNHIINLTLPSNLTTIGDNAFETNEITGKLIIPDSVISLGKYSFSHNQIDAINLSNRLTKISAFAFAYNKISGKLVIPDNITIIDSGAFRDNKITELVIPASVTTINRVAFANNAIKKITIEGDKTRFNDRWTMIGFPAELMPSA